MLTERHPEPTDLPEDGSLGHPDPLQTLEPSMQMPERPESNEVRDFVHAEAPNRRVDHRNGHAIHRSCVGLPRPLREALSLPALRLVRPEVAHSRSLLLPL